MGKRLFFIFLQVEFSNEIAEYAEKNSVFTEAEVTYTKLLLWYQSFSIIPTKLVSSRAITEFYSGLSPEATVNFVSKTLISKQESSK